MIFINLKTYGEGENSKVLNLVRMISGCVKETGIAIIPVVQTENAKACVGVLSGEIWVQHTDSPEVLIGLGVKGTFLNHSDHKLDLSRIIYLVSQCNGAGLKNMVFSANLEELKKVVALKPDFVAYEPPELIASPTTSVARAKPKIISDAAEIAKEAGIPLIVGAGVKDMEDVAKVAELGAVGVAVSSAVINAEDPKKVVLELAGGFK